jgi:YbbR domain-containing protein
VSLSADKVLVELPVVQELGYKTVPVVPDVRGTVAFGYQVVGIMVDPQSTTVAGDPRALADLSYLQTSPVDVSGAVGDVAVSAEPALPVGVALARSQTLFVRVLVSPVESSKTLEIAPQVKGAGDHPVTVDPGAVQVTVSGPMPVLTKLRPQDVTVTVDATGLIVGTHNIKPTVIVPSLLKLVSVAPSDVSVTVR